MFDIVLDNSPHGKWGIVYEFCVAFIKSVGVLHVLPKKNTWEQCCATILGWLNSYGTIVFIVFVMYFGGMNVNHATSFSEETPPE